MKLENRCIWHRVKEQQEIELEFCKEKECIGYSPTCDFYFPLSLSEGAVVELGYNGKKKP